MRKPETDSSTGQGAMVKSPSILVVDDNHVITKALTTLLRQSGYDPVGFETGAEALAYVEEHAPDAAVLDIHLPDISGLVLADRLRQKLGPDRPIIIVSGDTSMENIKSLPHVGATYFIGKPFNAQNLLQRLQELLT